MKPLISTMFAAFILIISSCSNNSGGGTVSPNEEQIFPELAGKWYWHDTGSDPNNYGYVSFTAYSSRLHIGYFGYNDTASSPIYGIDTCKGAWSGNMFRGSYRYYTDGGTHITGVFIQITFQGETFEGFYVDSSWIGQYDKVFFTGYKL